MKKSTTKPQLTTISENTSNASQQQPCSAGLLGPSQRDNTEGSASKGYTPKVESWYRYPLRNIRNPAKGLAVEQRINFGSSSAKGTQIRHRYPSLGEKLNHPSERKKETTWGKRSFLGPNTGFFGNPLLFLLSFVYTCCPHIHWLLPSTGNALDMFCDLYSQRLEFVS